MTKLPLGVACMLFSAACGAAETPATKPWRLHDALNLPAWLTLAIEHRTRYETLDNQFRANGVGGDQLLSFRTSVLMDIAYEGWHVGGEFLDARVDLDDKGTPLNNTFVDESDLLQGYVGWGTKDLAEAGLGLDIKGGRQTIDLGSRRLVARNSFRNDINSFTGLDVQLQSPGAWQLRSFFVLPVFRLPDQVADIRDGEVVFDREEGSTYFWGAFAHTDLLPWKTQGELYLFGLHEQDEPGLATSNRRLYTPGLRWFKMAAKDQMDFEVEAAYQTGTSRSGTKPSDNENLDQQAHFEHIQFGYTFDAPWTPRLLAQYDYASGDENPNDGRNNRFDPLFGARRFELGPTGMWGAFARSNINSPGSRIIVKPREDVSAFLGYRAF
ncbi:MAG: hypothetical protein H6R26_517, partial [Proteobacteria bacterium]|nr:hypothetical protein [Pseudomonadota bacterium]